LNFDYHCLLVIASYHYSYHEALCLSVGNVSDCTDPSDLTDLIDPCSSVVITQKSQKQRKNNSQSINPLLNSSQSIMDSVINTVAHSSDSITYGGASDGVSDVNKRISELKQTINNQNIIINNVVNRLKFLLSMFSIDEVSMPVLSELSVAVSKSI